MCEQVLKQEATSEAAYRLKMQIHRRLGDKAGLVRTYRDCEESLQGVFGLPPSEETQELFQEAGDLRPAAAAGATGEVPKGGLLGGNLEPVLEPARL